MRFVPVLQSAAIALVGRFNPAIFSPGWLLHTQVINETEFAAAETKFVHPEISDLKIGHLEINVSQVKFQILSSNEPFVEILDRTTQIFGRNLIHTPIDRVGVNYLLHFAVDSRKQQLALGRALAPIAPWGDWGKSLETADNSKAGGLRMLIMENSFPDGRARGHTRVEVQPSTKIDPAKGVYMTVNDEFVISPELAENGAAAAMSALEENFESSLASARKIVSDLMDFAAKL